MSSISNKVARSILLAFDRLPSKFKPTHDASGLSNWVPLSGIALVDGRQNVEPVAVATGMKCLPSSSISTLNGLALHDSHAEILAIRLFNYFLLQECHRLASTPAYTSPYIRRLTNPSPQPFVIDPRWHIWMYCSETPCGDSSMELIMAQQFDATPWTASKPVSTSSPSYFTKVDGQAADSPGLLGRGYFSELGMVRRKPARGDSPPTLSKSCSDKLAMKQCTSLLSSVTSLLVAPASAYLHGIILPETQYLQSACDRAWGPNGRMAAVADKVWRAGFMYRLFEVHTTDIEFRYSRRTGEAAKDCAGPQSKPSNIAGLWSPKGQEVVINGILQGRKKGEVRGASMVSRWNMGELLVSTVRALDGAWPGSSVENVETYSALKALPELEARRSVKADVINGALRGWVRNEQDDFNLHKREEAVESK